MRSNPIIIMALIVLFVALPGCSLHTGSKTKSFKQGAESPQQITSVSSKCPVDGAKSEELFNQGLKLYEQYNYQQAIVKFDRAIAANPANFKIYTAKGIALCFAGDYNNGMALIQKTLDLKPGYVPALYDMAMAYKLQDNYNKSLYWFKKVIQGDPNNTWSYYGIATIYADMGNTQESLNYLEKAIKLDPIVKTVAQQQSHFDQMRNMTEFKALVR